MAQSPDYANQQHARQTPEQGGPNRLSGLRASEDSVGELKGTGAVRSHDADDVRFDLLCPNFLRRMAETAAVGASKYGEYNWTKGFPIGSLINHAENHLKLFLIGDKSEPHLIHAAFNLMMADHIISCCPCEENSNLFATALKIYLKSRRIFPPV